MIISTIVCSRCHQPSEEAHIAGQPAPDICSDCLMRWEQSVRERWLRQQAQRPVEERLANIESLLYDIQKRLPQSGEPLMDG